MDSSNITEQTNDKPLFSLDNQRKALAYLRDTLAYANNVKLPQPNHLQEVLLTSSVYALTPRNNAQRLTLLLVIASRFDKVIEEIAQLYMAGPAESLLERTWLQAERREKAEKQKRQLEFIYAVIIDLYQTLAKDNPGMPLPYGLQPYASIVV